MSFRSAADHYVSRGFSVLPCGKDKKPLLQTWVDLQNRQPTSAELDDWAENYPDGNIAVVCGRLSDLTVVDADSPEAIQKIEGLLPDSIEVPTTTPRRGRHYYFRFTPELRSRNGTGKKIDVKSEGGYIQVPPSRTEFGTYVAGPIDIDNRTAMPEALLAFLKKGQSSPAPNLQGAPLTQGRRDEDLFHMALQLFKDGHSREEVERIVLTAARAAVPPFPEREARAKIESAAKRAKETAKEEDLEFIVCRPENVKVRKISWLWNDVVPLGMVTLIEGDPGIGKTFVAADITARGTTGRAFPSYINESAQPIQGKVIFITSEGVPDQILVPRLIAAEYNPANCEIIEGMVTGEGEYRIFDITQHLEKLKKKIETDANIILIIIDPLSSFVGTEVNLNSSAAARQAIDGLARLATETGVAVILISHFNKDDRKPLMHRSSGSVQIPAAVKSKWAVAQRKDDDNPDRRYFGPSKSNISRILRTRSLPFIIEEVPVQCANEEWTRVGRAVWQKVTDEVSVEDAVSPRLAEFANKISKAGEFLKVKLGDGPKPAADLYAEAASLNISSATLQDARNALGISFQRQGFGPGSRVFWGYGLSPDRDFHT